MARPLISRRMVGIARRIGAGALAHGCTGKGNDQLRFELSFAALAPDLKVVAPWREWDITSREDAFAYARARGISLEGVDEEKLYSRDENLWHISHEGGPLEDPANAPEPDVFVWTRDPMDAPDTPLDLELGFEAGVPVTIDGRPLPPLPLLLELNELGSEHGLGRADIVEDRVVGIKSRGVYETPGGTILLTAIQELEQLVLSRRALALKDELAPRIRGPRLRGTVVDARAASPRRHGGFADGQRDRHGAVASLQGPGDRSVSAGARLPVRPRPRGHPAFAVDVFEVFDAAASAESREVRGGTSAAALEAQLEALAGALAGATGYP